MADANHRRWLKRALLLLLAAAAAAFLFRNTLLGKPVEVYEAVRTDLVQTIVASGRIMTPRRIAVQSAEGTGTCVRVLIPAAENIGEASRPLDEAA